MKVLLIGFGQGDSSSSKLVNYIISEIDSISFKGIDLAEPINQNVSKVKNELSLDDFRFVVVIGETKGLHKIDLEKVNYLYSLDEEVGLAIEWTNWVEKWNRYEIPHIISNYTGDTYKPFMTFGLNEFFITNKYSANLININIPTDWRLVNTYKKELLEIFSFLK